MFIVPRSSHSLHRNLAQEFINSGVQRGMGSTAIYQGLMDAGLGYHKQSMYADISGWRDAVSNWKNVNNGDPNTILASDLYIETNRKIEANFETVVGIDIKDWNTGKISRKYLTIKHEFWTPYGTSPMIENRYTSQDILNIAEDIMSHYPPTGDIVGSQIIIGYRRPNNA